MATRKQADPARAALESALTLLLVRKGAPRLKGVQICDGGRVVIDTHESCEESATETLESLGMGCVYATGESLSPPDWGVDVAGFGLWFESPNPHQQDEFTRAYIAAALWSTQDDSDPETGGDFLDLNYGIEDVAPESLLSIAIDCALFQLDYGVAIDSVERVRGALCGNRESAGHDFWLTRCGHGAGFWDGDWVEPAATILTDASTAAGESVPYVGLGGAIHLY